MTLFLCFICIYAKKVVTLSAFLKNNEKNIYTYE